MRMYDLISKKKCGASLLEEEIKAFIDGVMYGRIPDYQISALLMAIYFKSMDENETLYLTNAMANSGDMLNLSSLDGITGDKHSTGGVGDKTTLIVAPIVAACKGILPKMSGRGLGHTGGTIDKLESIPDFKTDLSFDKFMDIIKENGFAIVCQTGQLAPADKVLYAIRDTTASVDSIPLIASSIMSKKLATGAEAIVLDVKVGSGAFMKTIGDARKLADLMVKTARMSGRKCRALITDMSKPLGNAIGNSIEVIEAIEVLKNKCKNDVYILSVELAANILFLQNKGTLEECRRMSVESIENGKALEKMKNAISLQGGDCSVIENYKKIFFPKYKFDIIAQKSGFISVENCEEIGRCAQILGAGRTVNGERLDYHAGIYLHKLSGEHVEAGDTIASLYSSKQQNFENISERFCKTYVIGEKYSTSMPIIIEYF